MLPPMVEGQDASSERSCEETPLQRLIQARSDVSIGSCDLHMDLRSAALRTKRPAILDGRPTLLARMFHAIEASALRTGRASKGIG